MPIYSSPRLSPAAVLRLESLEPRDVPAVAYAVAEGNQLFRYDPLGFSDFNQTRDLVQVTGLGYLESLVGLAFRPATGQLIGVTAPYRSTGSNVLHTYVIDPRTAAATLVGATAGPVPGGADAGSDISIDPLTDEIRYISAGGGNARLDPDTGALLGTGPAADTAADLVGAAFARSASGADTLYAISRATATLGTIDLATGAYTPVGSLGVTLYSGQEDGFDIAADASGRPVGYAFLRDGHGTGLPYTIDLATGAATPSSDVSGRVLLLGVADVAVVPEGAVVVGAAIPAGGATQVLDPATGAVRVSVPAPFVGYQGGVRVAAGDVNGDGVPDAVVAAADASNGHVKVFDGTTGTEIRSFFSFAGFTGSVSIAAGDVNGDGFADIIAVSNGNDAEVRVFSGKDGTLLSSFFAYSGFDGDVSVAAADFNNDGTAEIVTAAAINGHVKVFVGGGNFAGTLFTPAAADNLPNFQNSFLAFNPYLGDVSVAAGDFTGDGTPDIALVSGRGVRTNVRVVNGASGTPVSSFFVDNFGAAFVGGASIGVSDFNRDGRYDLVLTPGAGAQATAVAIDPLTGVTLGSFSAFADFQGGATVAGTRF